jgi:PKD domain
MSTQEKDLEILAKTEHRWGSARRLCLLLALAICAVAPAAAHADAIVYLKGGQVWVANPDGSGARQFTVNQYGWSSPSMADDGTVVAAGGLSRVNADGSDSDGSSEIYRFAGDGNQIGDFTPTYGSYSTPACPAYPPSSVRVSPDGSKIAYGIYACGDGGYQTALWTPAGSSTLNFPDQTIGQQDFWDPAWIDNSRFAISHAGPPVYGAHWGEHAVNDADNVGQGWTESAFSDRAAEAVISRDGKESVVFFNDAASYSDGKPRNLDMWVYSNPTMPADFNAGWGTPPAGCKFSFSDAASRFGDINNLSPSLSPDGSKVLWGEADGVHVMSLGDVTNACSGATSTAGVLLVPGGSQPFYAKGNVQPGAASPRQPGASPSGPGSTPTSGTTPGTVPAHRTLTPLARFSVRPKHLHVRKAITFDATKSGEAGGKIVSYSWSFGDRKTGRGRKVSHKYKKAGTYTVKLTVRDAAGTKATTKHKIKVKG